MLWFWLALGFFTLLAFLNYRLALYGLLVLIPTFLFRDKVLFVPTTFLEIGIYILAFVRLLNFVKNRGIAEKLNFQFSTLNFLFILLFFLSAITAVVASSNKRISLGAIKGWYFDPLLLALLVRDDLKKFKNWDFLFGSLNLSVLWLSIYGLLEKFFNIGKMNIASRLDSVFESPNYFAMYALPILALNLGLIFEKASFIGKKWRAIIFLTTLVGSTSLYFSQSYGGWLALSAVFFILLLRSGYSRIALAGAGVIFLTLFFSYLRDPSLPYKFLHRSDFTKKTSLDVRLQIWKTAAKAIKENPIWGIGLGNFKQAYDKYIRKVSRSPLELDVIKPHNVYLNFWAEQGILGLISFALLIIYFFLRRPKAWFALSMLAILIHGLVDTVYFKNDLSAIFWIVYLIGTNGNFS